MDRAPREMIMKREFRNTWRSRCLISDVFSLDLCLTELMRQKRLGLFAKLLLTTPTIIGLFYLLTFIFPGSLSWIYPTIKEYRVQMISVKIIFILQVVLLVRRIWQFKKVEKKVKQKWMWLLILYAMAMAPYYIWKKDDELVVLNNKSSV